MQITETQFELMFPHSTDRLRGIYFPYLQDTLDKYQINTGYRVSAFLAQVAVESENLRYVEELASGTGYDKRADLGNTNPTAIAIAKQHGVSVGTFYKGVGLIQITGAYNLQKCGEALGLDLFHNPKLLTQPENAWKSAGWYWSTRNCNSLADVGLFGKITYAINGGYRAADERLANYKLNKKILGVK